MSAEPYISPADADAFVWAGINEASRRKCCVGARTLGAFLRDRAAPFVTPKGDESTNIIDQGERVTYALPAEMLRLLFEQLEVCRLEGTATHFSERQGTVTVPKSGLMLDFDIVTSQRRPVLTDRHYHRLTSTVIAALQRDVDFGPAEQRLHVFFIVKPEAVLRSESTVEAATFKYGLHMLLPGVRLSRAYKKWLLRGLAADPAVLSVMADLGAVGDPAACLDMNSASVPVLFFGSCKRGAIPYILGAAVEVCLEPATGWTPPPMVRRLAPAELEGFNLVAELGLVAEADYLGARAPLVRKADYECRPELAAQVQDWAERAVGGATAPDELAAADNSLSTLTLHNAEARHIHALLDLLDSSYWLERNRWRDVVYALASSSETYKPLAVWFTQKCPAESARRQAGVLDRLWDEAVARRLDTPLTLRSITYWARTSNPEKFAEVMERSYFTMLTEFVYTHGGRLQHYMIAKVLFVMLGSKFCVDIDAGSRGAQSYCWFEFVLPGQAMRPGEVWKWRKEVEPDDVHIYMSEKLSKVLDQISEHLEEKRLGAADEAQAKYYKELGKAFSTSKGNLYNNAFKVGVIQQANYLFRRRGFVEQLDRLPHLFGTLNGVLELGPKCRLIAGFHEYPISRGTRAAWKPFDANDPWTRLVLDAIADIIIEPDARDWILFHCAQGLSGATKEGLFLLWEGGGQNGKTSFLRWIAKALGPYADKFNIQLMCSDREDADKANSAMMRFKHLNWAYSEESNQAQVLNVARMKEMNNPGEVSGRDLNSRQETFTMHANLVAASQYSFIVRTYDHGTWRRLIHYTSKIKFRRCPDPTNPFEKADDQRFVRQFPDDPEFVSSVLSVLTHYYERLQNEFNGELKNVVSPTILRESEAFRVKQDALHRWICETIVVSPDNHTDYPVSMLGGFFNDWYCVNVDRTKHVASEIIKEIESSALSKYLRPALNRTLTLKGCRVITPDEMELRPGESFISVGGAPEAYSEAGEEVKSFTASDKVPVGVHRTDGRHWWEAADTRVGAPEPPGLTVAGGSAADEFAADDAKLIRRPNGASAPATPQFETTDAVIDSWIAVMPDAPLTTDDLYAIE